MNTGFIYDDGGRAAAGYKGEAGDCVCRAIAIALEKPYQEIYEELIAYRIGLRQTKRVKGSHPRTGVNRTIYGRYLTEQGWRWHPTMKIGTGCMVHLRKEELPPGRLIVRVSGHVCAMIDGVIHDTFDPRRGSLIYYKQSCTDSRHAEIDRIVPETRCVYGYYQKREP
jgi:hypothetical protein